MDCARAAHRPRYTSSQLLPRTTPRRADAALQGRRTESVRPARLARPVRQHRTASLILRARALSFLPLATAPHAAAPAPSSRSDRPAAHPAPLELALDSAHPPLDERRLAVERQEDDVGAVLRRGRRVGRDGTRSVRRVDVAQRRRPSAPLVVSPCRAHSRSVVLESGCARQAVPRLELAQHAEHVEARAAQDDERVVAASDVVQLRRGRC